MGGNQMKHVALEYDNTLGSRTIVLQFGSTLNEGATNESWGVDNVLVVSRTSAVGDMTGDSAVSLQGPYYDVTRSGDMYILSDGTQAGTYTSNAAGTEIIVGPAGSPEYTISEESGDTVFTGKAYTVDTYASEWRKVGNKYYQVTANGDGSFKLSDGLGTEKNVKQGDLAVVEGVPYEVRGTSVADFALTASAMKFDGSGDYVNLGSPASLDLGTSFTIGAWIRPDQLKDYMGVVQKQITSRSGTYSYMLVTNSAGNIGSYTPNIGWQWYAGGITAGQWYYVAWVLDGSTMSYYVNGELKGTSSFTYPDTATNDVWIGAGHDTANYDFNGIIDEVSFWNRPLSAAEVVEIKNKELEGTETGLVSYYSFDLGMAADNGPSGNTGTITNAVAQTFAVEDVSDYGMTVFGEEYAVRELTDGRIEVYNNSYTATEGAGGLLVWDDVAHFIVTGEGLSSSVLGRVLRSDLDRDGDVDAADEEIIESSIEEGYYDRAADIDLDGEVTATDLAIFRTQRASVSDVIKHSVPGPRETKEYYITRSLRGVYDMSADGIEMSSQSDGLSVNGLNGLRYLI
jgi:hypothetical protein